MPTLRIHMDFRGGRAVRYLSVGIGSKVSTLGDQMPWNYIRTPQSLQYIASASWSASPHPWHRFAS